MVSISRQELERMVKCELSQAHKDFYGVGPGVISTSVIRNLINFKMQRCLTPLERELSMDDNVHIVQEMRQRMLDIFKVKSQLKSILGATLLDGMGKVLPEYDVLYGVLIYDKDLPVTC